jgi:hypothetical protein
MIKLIEEEEKLLPCNPIMAIKSIRDRADCSLREAKEAVDSHPKYKTRIELYDRLCPVCEEPVCIQCNGCRCICGNLIIEAYPKSVQEKLEQLIAEVDDTCIDNERIARKSNINEVEKYKDYRWDGCCGFVDEEFTAPEDGEIYLIGFNYGH